MFDNCFSKNCTVYEIMSINVMETKGPQMMSKYGAYMLHAGLARLHTVICVHTPTLPDTHMHAHTDQ
jgi:hypothetical protein